jgi:hypothetical protein
MDEEKDDTHIDNLLDLFAGKTSAPADENAIALGIPAGTGAAIKKAEKVNRPSTWDMGRHIYEALANAPDTKIGEQLSDPATAAALAAGAAGLYRSGAGINPLKPETFLQYDPRSIPLMDKAKGKLGGIYSYVESQLLPKVGPEGLAKATGKEVRTMHEVQQALEDITSKPANRAPVIKTVKGVPTVVRYAQTAARPAMDLTPLESTLGRMGSAITKVAPGLKPAGEFVKGALPTLGMVGKYAGIGGLLGDVGARAYGGDTTGAGISAAGGALGMMLAPQIGIPVALGSAAINYLRDNPELMDKLYGYASQPEEGEYPTPR